MMIILRAALARLWPFLGYGIAVIFFWLWIEAREDVATEVLACNASKLAEALESERVVRAAEKAASERERKRLQTALENAERAAEIAREAEALANERPERVKIVVRESNDACVNQPISDELRDSLWPDANNHEN